MNGEAFIEVRDVSKSFPSPAGQRAVLRGVSLEVRQGEFVAILGAMGSGKSTLLGILAGLIAPDAGAVSIGGERIHGIRSDAAFVFQNYSLLPWFTALENVRLAVQASAPGLTRTAQRERARRALEKVGLAQAVDRRPRQLSGGMRQRVAIARALASDPRVLFLDEPLGALDALTRESLQGELARLCGEGDGRVTTVMITNSVDEAILLSDRIVPILPGPPATLGTPIEVPLPRPRSAAQLAHDDAAAHVRTHVIATLTEAVTGRAQIVGRATPRGRDNVRATIVGRELQAVSEEVR
jgi:nitrate/nitrite transport system ATP-binding protein